MAPPRIHMETARDFTGGLNLADDPYSLADNETFDLFNVDLNRRGGFRVRRGQRYYADSSSLSATLITLAEVPSLWKYVDPTNVAFKLAASWRGQIRRFNGSGWADIRGDAGASCDALTNYAEMGGRVYIARYPTPGTTDPAAGAVHYWDGVGVSTTAIPSPGYADDLAAPTTNTFPPSHCLAVHRNVMWSALGDRLRWSHPGKAESWRTDDFIDIDEGSTSGNITALMPLGEFLLVFKERGIYAVYGSPPDGFSMDTVSTTLGVAYQTAVTKTENKVYFWDLKSGMWKYDGKSLEHNFRRLQPIIDDGWIDASRAADTHLTYHDGRVYAAFYATDAVASGGESNWMGLVYDIDLGKDGGGWTMHYWPNWGPTAFERSASGAAESDFLGVAFSGTTRLLEFDVPNLFADKQAATTFAIEAWYATRWFDDKNPAVGKRWKRPVVVAGGGQNSTMFVDVLTDYDPTKVVKTFPLTTSLPAADFIWDADNWDQANWSDDGGDPSLVLTGATLGNGVSKSLRFKNATSTDFIGQDWRVHSVTMKWIPKRVRS